MKLQRREQILLMVSGGLVALIGLYFLLFAGDSRPDDQLLADQTKFNTEIAKKKKDIETGKRDAKRLADWEKWALPADTLVARSLYNDWLRDLVDKKSKFQQIVLTAQEASATTRQSQFTRIGFKLGARTNLANLIHFLYRFYSAGYLHQIRSMSIKPDRTNAAKPDSNLVVQFSIEALSLPKAEAKTSLPKEPSHVLQLAKLDDYKPIVTRNFFGPVLTYSRSDGPPPPPPPPRKVVDAAQFAVVTAITEIDGEPQVWIQDRMAGKLWKLGAGEGFTIGSTRQRESGTVQSIKQEEVVVDFRGARHLLHNGDNILSGPAGAVPALMPTALPVPAGGPGQQRRAAGRGRGRPAPGHQGL